MNKKILLVSMPWASAKRPLLGLGVLHGKLANAGVDVKSLYLNLSFSKTFGSSSYEFFADNPSLYPLAEHLFAANLFGPADINSDIYIHSFFGEHFLSENPHIIQSVLTLRDEIIPKFIEECTLRINKLDYDIIGFTSTFNQIFPSLLVAKQIKRCSQQKIIILGGACFHDEMGVEYSKVFSDFIDYVFTGESDNSLPAFIEYLNGTLQFETIDGISKNGVILKDSIPIANCSDISIPIYDDYFEELNKTYQTDSRLMLEGLPFESSRGCWWGQKSHCTFCGLNSMGMSYRVKSDKAILDELITLSEKHNVNSFLAADNILDNKAYYSLLEKMNDLPFTFNLFYEIKSNTKRENIISLHNAGINWVQPGIESFSTNILRSMKKGVTDLQNIQFLKYAKECGIRVSYNILTGFQGETIYDYKEMIEMIKTIFHLPPPSGVSTSVQIHRFSPMFSQPNNFGFKDIKPTEYYNYLFPKDFINLKRIAYFFDGETNSTLPDSLIFELNSVISAWIDSKITITAELCPNFILIQKCDHTKIIEYITLDKIKSIIFILCDSIISSSTLINKVKQYAEISSSEINVDIEYLLNKRLILFSDDKYLNIIPFSKPVTANVLENWLLFASSIK